MSEMRNSDIVPRPSAIRVLLVEDDRVDRMAFERFVAGGRLPYDCTIAASVFEATRALGAGKFDVAIVDYRLGDGTAFDLFGLLGEVPCIMVTGSGEEDIAVRAMKSGASDYIVKDGARAYLSILPRTVENAILRSRTDKALKESEEKFRVLAERSPNMIFINKGGCVVYANEKCEEVMGYTREEFLSPDFNFLTLIAPESLELVGNAFGRQMKGEDMPPFEYALLTRAGARIEAIITTKLIDLGGERAILGIITDITDRKNMEKELREFSGRLEVLVKERTAELETEVAERKRAEKEIGRLNEDLKRRIVELEEARILAEAGIKARGAFLANISHELITPLNSIIGFSQILIDGLGGPMNEQQKDYAASILQGGNRLHETLKEIVQFAGLESGEMQLHADRFLLKDLLKSSLLAFNEKAAVAGVALSLETGLPPETEIEADRVKLHQAMFSVLDNAIKFTPAGGNVRVSARKVEVGKLGRWEGDIKREAEKIRSCEDVTTNSLTSQPLNFLTSDADSIVISVTDTGIGIKEEDMQRLFKTFEQLEAPYTKQYKGTGLGLVLAKKIIELHGGRIWVESVIGKGSVFTFSIPVEQAGARDEGRETTGEGRGGTERDQVRTENSLR